MAAGFLGRHDATNHSTVLLSGAVKTSGPRFLSTAFFKELGCSIVIFGVMDVPWDVHEVFMGVHGISDDFHGSSMIIVYFVVI